MTDPNTKKAWERPELVRMDAADAKGHLLLGHDFIILGAQSHHHGHSGGGS